jgi:hypothetical protein
VTPAVGRTVCWGLAGIDAVLGSTAALFPETYLALIHPGLPPGELPADWVVRTGVLWLIFMVFELSGALSPSPAKWFFCVAMLRWMEVPADLAYGLLARGATLWSRLAIFTAPVVNGFAGAVLFVTYRRLSGK